MKALITGGTGFIGSHLAEALTAAGAEVYALVRDPANIKFLRGTGVRVLHGDLTAVPAIPPGLDRVFHLAGLTKALQTSTYYTVNERGTANLLDAVAARNPGVKVVVLSSLAACGPSDGVIGRRECDPPAPVSPYGKSKRAGEIEALSRTDRCSLTIIRVGVVFGPRDSDFLNFFRSIRRGILPAFGRRTRPFSVCYVRDLVQAIRRASETETASGEIFNVGNAAPSSFEEIGRIAAGVLERRVRRIVIPLSAVRAAALASEAWSRWTQKPSIINRHKFVELKQRGWTADMEKARLGLGFVAATSLEDGLRETLRWYLDQGWL